MFLRYRTQGIILKKVDRGEADQVLVIYTKDFGKLEILARAIRKVSSKLRPAAEIFYLSEIEFIQGKNQKTLTGAVLIDRFSALRSDLKKLAIAYKIAQVFDDLIKGQEPESKIWRLLKETFNRLSDYQTAKVSHCQILYYYFLWNLLSVLGYQPDFYNCYLCGQKLKPEKLYFNPKEDGIICKNCFKLTIRHNLSNRVKSIIEVNPETIKILRIILKKNLPLLLKLNAEKVYLQSLGKITENFISKIYGERISVN